MTPSVQLSDTSAFVILLMSDGIHVSKNSQRYMDMLDLSCGIDLLKDCTRVWPHLGEIVLNRKSTILQEVKFMMQDGAEQVIIFGSGMDALSLEITSLNNTVQVYEVDAHHMKHKQQLLNKAMQSTHNITCITADLNQPSRVISKIADAGWDKNRQSVLIFEGISYYLKSETLWEIIRQSSSCAANHVIVEYMVPSDMIDAERAHIPDDVFGIIQNSLPDNLRINRFGYDTIVQNVRIMGGSDIRRHTMSSIEKRRTGTNRIFPTESSGWIEVACFKTAPVEL
ncbi:MAG: class I SAM-dependent methyltransferase [Cenarchaeum sp. SB0665_bin_23]|nr:class I SAM-dependent methyltransferase [Cenarchaeum sp. SB0667_bin_13]MXY61287.1 class I SAM-dependent methyltransferase [Cenarchaeum sp. SB0665_bin_23]MXZ93114.1 class I SAM-dependent methyltransferase [Cenarchaeum sp. SB0666_bin_15]MYB47498.1 class I SAM-dependent methyltransferase [Cenarchaeum sp. SB0662_bin_33]MYC79063.1 class I SAM-dependent methyltransferase [Cenarchaeum sp. SB0661_bin_35]MYD58596.1 class I SAM-dependent methyltransferase [Cenarchaeum sp. SB0678_bin_8]MYG32759.1 cla